MKGIRWIKWGAASMVVALSIAPAFGTPTLSRNYPSYILVGLDSIKMKDFAFTNAGNLGVQKVGGVMQWGRKSFFQNQSQIATDILARAGEKSSMWDLFANSTPASLSNSTIRDAGP